MRIDGTCDRPSRRVHRPGPSLQKNHQRCRRAEAGTAVQLNGFTSRKIKNSRSSQDIIHRYSSAALEAVPLRHVPRRLRQFFDKMGVSGVLMPNAQLVPTAPRARFHHAAKLDQECACLYYDSFVTT
jgi:hypothetical protein